MKNQQLHGEQKISYHNARASHSNIIAGAVVFVVERVFEEIGEK